MYIQKNLKIESHYRQKYVRFAQGNLNDQDKIEDKFSETMLKTDNIVKYQKLMLS